MGFQDIMSAEVINQIADTNQVFSIWQSCWYPVRQVVRNRFKGLDLIDRLPDELWNEVRDIVQETGIKTIPWKRNAKKQNGCLKRPYK